MKHLKHLTPLIICLLAISCASPGHLSKDPVVIAEHAIVDGKAGFDAFVHLEAINRDLLLKVDPAIHAYAEKIRKNGAVWLQQAYDLKQAYKSNSSAANLFNLQAVTATINEAIAQSNYYVGSINTTIATKP